MPSPDAPHSEEAPAEPGCAPGAKGRGPELEGERGPWGAGPHTLVSRLWPAALVIAVSATVLVLPLREEEPCDGFREGSGAIEAGRGPGRSGVPPGDGGGGADLAVGLLNIGILVAGGAVLASLLWRRTRAWLLPPPARAPHTAWGWEQLFYGVALALEMPVLAAGAACLFFSGSGLAACLLLAAGSVAASVAIVALAALRPSVLTLPLRGEGAHGVSARAGIRSLGLSLEDAGANALRGLVGVLGTLPVVYAGALAAELASRWAGAAPPVHPVIERVTVAGAAETAVLVVAACVVAPVFEELLFRGFLYPALRERFGFAGAAVASSLLFATVHPGLPGKAVTFVLGLSLCLLYERAGTLVSPVVAHAAFNAVQIGFVLVARALG